MKGEQAIFANLCMVYDDDGRVLVQQRRKSSWPGISFPGGHVEPGESFVEAVIREVYEETGLRIFNPLLCGVKQFPMDDGIRYVVLLYKTNQFSGELRSSEEGDVFWARRDELTKLPLATDLAEMLPIFETNDVSEYYYYKQNGRWKTKLL